MYEIFSKELLKTLIKSIFCFDKNLEGATPDPIPNSEVKSFSADGTLS